MADAAYIAGACIRQAITRCVECRMAFPVGVDDLVGRISIDFSTRPLVIATAPFDVEEIKLKDELLILRVPPTISTKLHSEKVTRLVIETALNVIVFRSSETSG
ncbi:hypothetical protein BLNAU_5083 [Blattamonas nauphoetae]|uniref:Uncharacterized protein n=1 Tax=Blattamonas nauphoetae TaxID=2049346 RepID=A0ABQ9Y847_9EUKA|nr:hypothetical protein BLNAU_5083 [Blattamonas nauphoetae]